MLTNVKRRDRKLKSGTTALYFDYKVNGERIQQHSGLHLYLGKDPQTKALNKEVVICFNAMLAKKQTELLCGIVGTPIMLKQNANFFKYYQEYMEKYPSKERRAICTFKKLQAFYNRPMLPISVITEDFLIRFKNYLESTLTGETPYNYFKKLKQILQQATRDKLFQVNPAEAIKLHRSNNDAKETLSIDELKILARTECSNDIVKRAFLFSTVTGLRFCDVKKLTWRNIQGCQLFIVQSKTQKPVLVPLTSYALQLIGEPSTDNDLVFTLPTANGTNKNIKAWIRKAGIEKDITFHCARHTAGTNLHLGGVDVISIASILGHTSVKHTQRYVRNTAEHLHKAINLLPSYA